jgi:uncharacterized membrane protein YdjX (TVP38/TMEM64 family)
MLIGLVLMVPLLPFLVLGSQMDAWSRQWIERPPGPLLTASLVVGILALDIFLPVPSSFISTLAGMQLGVAGGTASSWLGLSLGAVVGFALARRWGHPVARRWSTPHDLQRMETLSDRYGPLALILVRGVPLLAEASVLLVGMHRLSWRRFLPPVLVSNFALAVAYAAMGDVAQRHHWLPLAVGVSIALPVLLAMLVKGWLSQGT